MRSTSFRRRALAALAALAVVAGVGGATSLAASPPPLIVVQAIGSGKVTGTGLNCGLGKLQCVAAYGSANPVNLTATPANASWTFDHWDGGACDGTPANPCAETPGTPGANTADTAVFTSTGSVAAENLGVAVSGPTGASGTVANGSATYPISCAPDATPALTDCSLTVLQGSTLAMVETPDAGLIFAGWGGSCSGDNLGCAVSMSGNKAVSATFGTTATNTLEVKIDGNGSVTGGGITCYAGSTCDKNEPLNSTVTLTAAAQDGYVFTGWDGDCTGTQSTCTVTMDDARSVTASFDQLIPVVVTVNGNGTVTGAGITCGPGPKTCNGGAAPSTTLLLTGTPATGTSVTWSGCTSTSGTICRISVPATGAVAVTATFGGGTTPPPATVSLTIDVNGNGYVTATSGTTAIYCTASGGAGCTTSVQQNTSLTLRAVPASGSSADFSDWGDDCDAFTSTTCTLSMTSAMTVTADFVGTSTTYTLSGSVQGSGTGTISGAGLHCSSAGGTGCSSPQAATAKVTMTATASFGSAFSGWSGACSGASPTCTVDMSAAKSVVATFTRAQPGKQPLAITVNGAGKVKAPGGVCAGTVKKPTSCTQEYTDGQKVTITAVPSAGYGFTGWTGACKGTKRTCSLTLSTAQAVTATFTALPLAPGHKPRVAKVKGAYRVTLYYTARVAGTLRVVGTRSGTRVVAHTKKVKKGKGKVLVTVKRAGTYRFVLTLTAKKHKTSIRWAVKAK